MAQQIVQLKRLGHIFTPTGTLDWMSSHASCPFVLATSDPDQFKVIVGTRDKSNRTSLALLTMQHDGSSFQINHVDQTPLVSPGKNGAFDEDGVSMGCITEINSYLHLYYVGWNLAQSVPWRNFIGLAKSETRDLDFKKVGRAPVLDRNNYDPYSVSYPYVVKQGDRYAMYYGTNLTWGKKMDSMTHGIRRAWSYDGISWQPEENLIFEPKISAGEPSLSRPCIFKFSDTWIMLFGSKTNHYKLAAAISKDGLSWIRDDALVEWLNPPQEWDSSEQCYPMVFNHRGKFIVAYNGNGYGKSGFGLAELSIKV